MISVDLTSFGNVFLVEVAGEFDSSGAAALSRAVEEALEAESQAIVVDLSGIITLDIDGLRVLHAGLKQVRRAGGDMCLAAPSDPALESLGASRLDEIFKIFETTHAAIASF